jgi:hypothetical protein
MNQDEMDRMTMPEDSPRADFAIGFVAGGLFATAIWIAFLVLKNWGM